MKNRICAIPAEADAIQAGFGHRKLVVHDQELGARLARHFERAGCSRYADRTVAADHAFHFIGTAKFDGVAGELHYQVANGVTVVEGDVNGDCHADFQIELSGSHTLTCDDFLL